MLRRGVPRLARDAYLRLEENREELHGHARGKRTDNVAHLEKSVVR